MEDSRDLVEENYIVVVIEDGLVQDVRGVPKGYGLAVVDYDVEGAEDDEVEKYEGRKAYISEWVKLGDGIAKVQDGMIGKANV